MSQSRVVSKGNTCTRFRSNNSNNVTGFFFHRRLSFYRETELAKVLGNWCHVRWSPRVKGETRQLAIVNTVGFSIAHTTHGVCIRHSKNQNISFVRRDVRRVCFS